MEDQIEASSLDDVMHVLASPQRRKLLVALLDHNPQSDSPVVIADDENERDAVERLVEMEHVHLPKLEDHGFIEWDQENNEVSKGPKFEDIRPLLKLMVDHMDELPPDWI